MIKECKVVLHNSAVVVVDFGGTKVQFPATKINDKVAYVEYVNGKYSVVSKEDYEKSLKSKVIKKPKKVETIDEIVESEAVENETDEISE